MPPTLEDHFANAPFAENGWTIALEELGRRTGSQRAQIIGIGGPSAIPFNYVTDPGDGGLLERFVEINGADPRVNWRVAATRGPFDLVWENDYQARRRAGRFEIYDDFAETFEMPHGCQTLLSNDSRGFLGLATLRSRADGETSEEQRSVFAEVAPSVLRAIRMQQAMHHQGAQLLVGAMEAMNSAAFLLDADGRIIALTPQAERAVSRQTCVALRQSRLRAVDRAGDQRLHRAIGRLLPMAAGEAAARLWLNEPASPGRGLVCEIYPLPARDWSFGAAPRLLLSLRAIEGQSADARDLLGQAFGLSAAEAQVALMLAAGRSRADVARQRGVRPETVNDQLKSIFRKTEVRREAELVALVTRLIG